ncbi:hypothetical protein L195_g056770 [Trifolium pratense]|uniref:Uncharacterized protein n=1 Tax=Trifolium pratense TaxID=57577 RepID=A0A2K3KTB3_TRIPR|nr:hypothetical protein L195_g056770 [Trifolium pratense]
MSEEREESNSAGTATSPGSRSHHKSGQQPPQATSPLQIQRSCPCLWFPLTRSKSQTAP